MYQHLNKILLILLLVTASARLYAAEHLRNPTAPANEPSFETDNNNTVLSLQSIVRYGNQYWAIINGQILKVGDHINQAEIMTINHNQVKLIDNNKILVLSLFDDTMNK